MLSLYQMPHVYLKWPERVEWESLRSKVQGISCISMLMMIVQSHVFKTLAIWVCAGLLGMVTVNFLRTGHTHEDIDMIFASLAKYIWRKLHQSISIAKGVALFVSINPESRILH